MGGSTISEVIGVFASIVVLAAITVAVVNGGKVAKIITASGNAFSKSLKIATHQ